MKAHQCKTFVLLGQLIPVRWVNEYDVIKKIPALGSVCLGTAHRATVQRWPRLYFVLVAKMDDVCLPGVTSFDDRKG